MKPPLRDSPEELAALITATAAHLSVPKDYVEKDFWVTEVLRIASRKRMLVSADGESITIGPIFKGGTSLSRVFGITQRFSEDVDLLVTFPTPMGAGARHKAFKAIANDVSAHLCIEAIVPAGGSTTGVKRSTRYPYTRDSRNPAISESVLLELGNRGGAWPSSTHIFRSLICHYVRSEGAPGGELFQEFEPFEVEVLAPVRTLLEKLAAVHCAVQLENAPAIAQSGRHLYDIFHLLSNEEVRGDLRRLGQNAVAELSEEINTHSARALLDWAPRPDGGFADSPVFDAQHPARASIVSAFDFAQDLFFGGKFRLPELDELVALHRNLL